MRRLARGADIVVENFRPGALENWGLGYDRLAADNPGLVMVRLSGYGQTGPYRDQPGFGAIGEAMGGIRFVTGYPDRPPVRAGISLGDSVAALYGVIGALMALHARQTNGGRGQVVDVALYEAVFSLMESLLPEYDVTGFVRGRSGASLPGIVPSNTYTTRDGKYLVIGANADSIFKRLMTAIGREDLADDPALADNEGRVKRTEELDKVIGAWAAGRDLDEALAVLARAQVPAARSTTSRTSCATCTTRRAACWSSTGSRTAPRSSCRGSCPSCPARRAARAGSGRGWARIPTRSWPGSAIVRRTSQRCDKGERCDHDAHSRDSESEGRHDIQHRARGLLAEAVSLMVKHDIGSLVVLSEGAMVGMVTFREVLAALDAAGGSLGRRTVEEVMVKDPVCGKPDDTIDHMRSLMTEHHVRYLPIMEDGRLTGVLSFHDVARAALKAASFENRLLKQYIKNWPEPDPADGAGASPPAADR